MGKRVHQDSAEPFLSYINASNILNGDIDIPGGFIEGRIFSTNPGKNLYTIDVRPNSKAKAVYLDVFIADKLQRRLGELTIGDHLRILLRGAQLLPYPGAHLHLPAIVRFTEGITILLVSGAGLQGEKEKLYSVWPRLKAGKAKKRKQEPNVDNPDVGWFSTPPQSEGNFGVEEGTYGTQASATGGPNLTNSAKPHGDSSHATFPTPPSHSEKENDAESSTSATTSKVLSSSRKSPLTTGESRGTATFAYRTAPSREHNSPAHPTSSPVHSTILPIPAPSTSKQLLGRNAALPSGGPSEPRNYSATGEPSSRKQPSKRRRRREGLKEVASSADSTPPATTKAPTPTKSTPITPTTAEDRDIRDLPQQDNGQTELDANVTAMPADMLLRQVTVAQPAGEQAGSDEDADVTGEIVNAEPLRDDQALSMRAGLIVNGWPYTALSKIRPLALMSIIGVVSSVAKEPSQSQKGDWCICISLLDPSVLDSFGGVLYGDGVGTKVNCFMKLEQWLPNPKRGDIVLLRQVKIQLWNDILTGTCFSNTMQWAIYDPLTKEVLQPDSTLSSLRSHNPPTWNVVSQEREYCAQLTRWWAAVQHTRVERQGTAIQIGGGPVVPLERKHINRQHLLISEADPGREPRGYFNCTVEILHGHTNHVSDIYSIYVTDYTSKPGTFAEHSSDWCPVSLADRVLRIEMWRDKAVALAQTMTPGEYWALDNVRMKINTSGYIEGSFSEADKARRLSTADVDENLHLQALLKRKKVWEENDTNPHVFPHKLFDEVELQSIFDCTVEVLHAEYNATGTSILYITDYTERSDLATPPITLWSRRLDGRIVTLELQGQQSKIADKMETGSFFTVKHMRLIERVMGNGRVVGRIGGPDRLIHKLNTNNPNEELEKILERKKRWKGERGTAGRKKEGFTTIARALKSDKRVNKFHVRARVVGTFPLRLEDCVVRCCKSCSEQLPAGMDTCTPCTDPDGATPECENVFHLFLRLQDEHAPAQITVAVDQNSSILGGLTPDDVVSALCTNVRKCLAGYIGNLEAVQVASSQGRTLEAKVPVREFTIESWYVEDEEGGAIAYGLV